MDAQYVILAVKVAPAAVYELHAPTATQLLAPVVNVHKPPELFTLPLQKVNLAASSANPAVKS